MLEKATGTVTLTTALIIAFSVAYDWAYFQVFDSKYFTMMSLSDHVAATLDRLPLYVASIFFALVIALIPSKGEVLTTDNRSVLLLDIGKAYFSYRRPGVYLMGLSIIWLAVDFLSEGYDYGLAVPAQFAFQWLAAPTIRRFWEWGIGKFAIYFYFIPMLAIVALVVGASSASHDMRISESKYEIQLSSGDTLSGVILIRSMQPGLLIRDTHARMNILLSWQQISRVSNEPKQEKKSRACRWFNLCFPS